MVALGVVFPLLTVVGLAQMFWPHLQHSRAYLHLARMPAPEAHSLLSPVVGGVVGARSDRRLAVYARAGSPVSATSAGMVLAVHPEPNNAALLVLGAGGLRHHYSGLRDVSNVRAGDWLESGDLIGHVAEGGSAPHVRYAVLEPSGQVLPSAELMRSAAR